MSLSSICAESKQTRVFFMDSCEAEVALDAVYRFDWPHPLGVFSEKDALAGILAANRRTR